MKKKILVVLESRNLMEVKNHRALCHDGGQLLIWFIKRHSIAREDWVHTYCFGGANKKQIPTKQLERKTYLKPHVDRLIETVSMNSPCVVIGMGKLSSEILAGGSLLNKKVNTYWHPNIIALRGLGVNKVWITHNPEAALYSPELLVGMSYVFCMCAEEANIPFKLDYTLPMFNFSNYQ